MAGVDIDYARSVVKQMYPNDKWRSRVRKMSDNQVLAIYYAHERDRYAQKVRNEVPQNDEVSTVADNDIDSPFTPYYGEQLKIKGIF